MIEFYTLNKQLLKIYINSCWLIFSKNEYTGEIRNVIKIKLSILLTLISITQFLHAGTLECTDLFNRSPQNLLSMQSHYIGENLGHYYDKLTKKYWKVHYFSDAELESLTLTIRESAIYNFKKEKYSTEFDPELGTYKEALVVLTAEKKLLILPYEARGVYHHSSLSRGQKVLFAGTITIANGQIISLTDLSGHYKPSFESLIYFIKHLESYHLDLRQTLISGFNVYHKTRQHSLTYNELKKLFKFDFNDYY